MITVGQIINAVAEKLKANFGFPVYSENTKKGFTKSCFFIELVDNKADKCASEIMKETVPIRITYIALNNKQLKTILRIRSKLTEMFLDGLEVTDDCYINLEEGISFTLTQDNNLECLLEFELYQLIQANEDDLPELKELDTNLKKG